MVGIYSSRWHAVVFGVIMASILLGCEAKLTDAQLVEHAKDAWDQGDIKTSVISLKSALEKNPNNPEARFLLGKVYLGLENGFAAEQDLRRAVELNIPMSAVAIDLARAMLLESQFQKVLDELPPALMTDARGRASLLAYRAKALVSLGKMAEADQALKDGLALDPGNADTLVTLTQLAFLRGDMSAARNNIDAALAANKDDPEVWYTSGELHRLANDNSAAREDYDRVIKARPYDMRARLGRASVAIASGDISQADADAQSILKLHKDHPLATYVRGVVEYKKGKYEEALAMFQKASKNLPDFKPMAFWLSLTYVALGQPALAADSAETYYKAYPQSVEARKLKAYIDLRQNRPKEAISMLASLESDPMTLKMLGSAYMSTGNVDKGAAYLRQAAESAPDKQQANAAYSLALLEQGKTEEAMEQMRLAGDLQAGTSEAGPTQAELLFAQKLIEKKAYKEAEDAINQLDTKYAKNPDVMNLRGGLYLAQGKVSDAVKVFEGVLAAVPGYPIAAHNLALLALRDKDTDKARGLYLDVVKHYPNHVPTLLALYNLDKATGKNKEAMEWLEQAEAKQPENVTVATLLAREYIAQGRFLEVVSVTDRAITKAPDDEGLLEVRGSAQLQTDQPSNALHSFKRLTELQPKSAQAFFYLAQAQAVMGNPAETRKALQKTLKLDPKHLGAVMALAKLDIQEGRYAEARKAAADIQRQSPRLDEGWVIEYDAQMEQKQYSQALQTAQDLIDKGRANTANVLRAARAQWAAGQQEGAIQRVQAWIATQSKDADAHLYVAQAQEALGKRQEAKQAYERVLALAPDNPVALNNLAWLIRDEDTTRAVKLAEQAYKKSPNSPALADTYGMVLVISKQYQQAAEVLGGAARRSTDLNIQYHYALSLARAGQPEEAKAILSRALDAKGDFSERQAAQGLLKELSGRGAK